MKVALFEGCRRPDVLKPDTEAQVLSECFAHLGIACELYTNLPSTGVRPGWS